MKGRLAQIDANRMEPLGWNNVETFLKNGPPDKGENYALSATSNRAKPRRTARSKTSSTTDTDTMIGC
jgi:hypothetical protein